MLVRVLIQRKHHSLWEYLAALMLVIGISEFLLGDKVAYPRFNAIGLLLITLAQVSLAWPRSQKNRYLSQIPRGSWGARLDPMPGSTVAKNVPIQGKGSCSVGLNWTFLCIATQNVRRQKTLDPHLDAHLRGLGCAPQQGVPCSHGLVWQSFTWCFRHPMSNGPTQGQANSRSTLPLG